MKTDHTWFTLLLTFVLIQVAGCLEQPLGPTEQPSPGSETDPQDPTISDDSSSRGDERVLAANDTLAIDLSGTKNVVAVRFRLAEETSYTIRTDSEAQYEMDNKGKSVSVFWYGGDGEVLFHQSQANSATPHYDYHFETSTPVGLQETHYGHKKSAYSGSHTWTYSLPPGDWTFFEMYPGADSADMSFEFEFDRNVTFVGKEAYSESFLVDERDFDSTLAAYAAFTGTSVKATCSFEVEHGFFGSIKMIGGFYAYRLTSPDGEVIDRTWRSHGPEHWSPGTWTIEVEFYTGFSTAIVVGGVDMRLPGHPDGPAANDQSAVCAR